MTRAAAAVFAGKPGSLELRSFETPTPGPREILVRVAGCTLCGSDLHSYHGRRQTPTPTVLGHEIVGHVVALGASGPADVAGQPLQIGDRITWAIVAHCGECFYCRRDLPQKCTRGVKYGHEALQPGRELLGGLAEYCLLTPGTSAVRLTAELPLSVACPASCATATIAAALEVAGDLNGAAVCIFGAGMLGLTAAAMARSAGAAAVLCVDPIAARRERSLQFGATRAAAPDELADAARQTAGEEGFDVALELSGSPAAFEAAWPLLRIGGTLVLVGAVFASPPVPLLLEQVVRRQLTIRGVHNYAPRHLARAVDFLAANHERYPFAELVSRWLPLADAAEAFRLAAQPETIRVGVGGEQPAC